MDMVFLIGVVYTISKTIRGLMGGTHHGFRGSVQGERKRAASTSASTVEGRTVRDPVCGMFVSTEVSHRLVQGKEVLHFCSEDCLEKYEKQTAKVSASARS